MLSPADHLHKRASSPNAINSDNAFGRDARRNARSRFRDDQQHYHHDGQLSSRFSHRDDQQPNFRDGGSLPGDPDSLGDFSEGVFRLRTVKRIVYLGAGGL